MQLSRVGEDLELPAGTVLCKEGDIGHEFFVIIGGRVEVTRKGKKLAIRGGGDFVGEIALLEDTRRMATVTATEDVRAFVLTGPDFRYLLDQSPTVERKVLRALARRVAELSDDPTVS
ncbi:MAG TPA: cyclic nucleotide-binding domain-containing protein [Thermoleophilaceae bacterium]